MPIDGFNSFIPLLAGIPILLILLFTACCSCVDAVRKYYYYYQCKPRSGRRVRFDCEQPNNQSVTNSTRLLRSNTLPALSGLMAHSSYLQRNSNYRYNSVVNSIDSSGAPIQPTTSLCRISSDRVAAPAESNFSDYLNGSRRSSSTSTPTGQPYYTMRPKSPFEACGSHVEPKHQRRFSTPNSPTMYARSQSPRREESSLSSISYLPEVRAYMQFMEVDPSSRQRSHSFSGRNSSITSSTRRSPRRAKSTRHHRPRSRSPSPFAHERTFAVDEMSNYSSPSSFGRYLTPQGSSDQGSFRSPESGTPDWLDSTDERPPSYEDCLSSLSRSSSIRTSFI